MKIAPYAVGGKTLIFHRQIIRRFLLRIPQIVIIVSFHNSGFSETVIKIKALCTNIILMYSEGNRANTKFVVNQFDYFF